MYTKAEPYSDRKTFQGRFLFAFVDVLTGKQKIIKTNPTDPCVAKHTCISETDAREGLYAFFDRYDVIFSVIEEFYPVLDLMNDPAFPAFSGPVDFQSITDLVDKLKSKLYEALRNIVKNPMNNYAGFDSDPSLNQYESKLSDQVLKLFFAHGKIFPQNNRIIWEDRDAAYFNSLERLRLAGYDGTEYPYAFPFDDKVIKAICVNKVIDFFESSKPLPAIPPPLPVVIPPGQGVMDLNENPYTLAFIKAMVKSLKVTDLPEEIRTGMYLFIDSMMFLFVLFPECKIILDLLNEGKFPKRTGDLYPLVLADYVDKLQQAIYDSAAKIAKNVAYEYASRLQFVDTIARIKNRMEEINGNPDYLEEYNALEFININRAGVPFLIDSITVSICVDRVIDFYKKKREEDSKATKLAVSNQAVDSNNNPVSAPSGTALLTDAAGKPVEIAIDKDGKAITKSIIDMNTNQEVAKVAVSSNGTPVATITDSSQTINPKTAKTMTSNNFIIVNDSNPETPVRLFNPYFNPSQETEQSLAPAIEYPLPESTAGNQATPARLPAVQPASQNALPVQTLQSAGVITSVMPGSMSSMPSMPSGMNQNAALMASAVDSQADSSSPSPQVPPKKSNTALWIGGSVSAIGIGGLIWYFSMKK